MLWITFSLDGKCDESRISSGKEQYAKQTSEQVKLSEVFLLNR